MVGSHVSNTPTERRTTGQQTNCMAVVNGAKQLGFLNLTPTLILSASPQPEILSSWLLPSWFIAIWRVAQVTVHLIIN